MKHEVISRAYDPIDMHVGQRIRDRRRELGVSQGGLADHLGLTFQQIQKYERGTNRVSASMLFKAAGFLEVSPAWFFEGLPAKPVADADPLYQQEANARAAWGATLIGRSWIDLGRALPAQALDTLMRTAKMVVDAEATKAAAAARGN